ncbi:MAG: hypothetical protein V1744_02275 [Candidatus Altiarchaeota archaeon]
MASTDTGSENVVGVSLNVLRELADDLDSNEKLKEVFGDHVSEKIAVVAVGNDLKVVEYPPSSLSEGQKKIFLEELDRIMRKHLLP